MKINETNVSQLLSGKEKGLSARELLGRLEQPQKKKAFLRKVLKNMAQKGLTRKENNRYQLVGPQAPVSQSSTQRKAGTRKPSKRTLTKSSYTKGIYLLQNGEPQVRVPGEQKPYPIRNRDAEYLMHGDEIQFVQSAKHGPFIKVIRVAERNTRTIRGTLIMKKGKFYCQPTNKRFTQMFLVSLAKEDFLRDGEKVLIQITQYPAPGKFPEGIIVSSLSGTVDPDAEYSAILKEFEVPTEFPPFVLKECEILDDQPSESTFAGRTDLRNMPFVTIDGDDAKDFDDAIYAEKEGGGYRVWVSIADVSEYVVTGSPLDKEAYMRATSVYLPGTVYPMLPEKLSNGLCSLRPDENRLTLTCEMLLDTEGELKESKVYESVISSHARLTYNQVQKGFDEDIWPELERLPTLKTHMQLYYEIYRLLKDKRAKRGAIQFSFPDNYFEYDNENHVIDIRKSYQSEAMGLIEQFMLEANETIGKFAAEKSIPVLWRNHPQPLPEKLRQLRLLLWNAGIKMKSIDKQEDLNRVLMEVQEHDQKDALEYALLRSMAQASYEIVNIGHYGIAAPFYCHFTSPIRRYPDLLLHRYLKFFIKGEKLHPILEKTAVWVSKRERLAASAERAAVGLKKMLFMADKIGENFEGRVSGVHWNGLFVEIDHPYVEGFVPLHMLTDDFYQYHEASSTLIGRKSGNTVRVGKALEISLTRLDMKHRSPEFEWLNWL